MARISGVVNTLNEARNIRYALGSLAWCDELVVVDQFSEDGTADLAREMGARVFTHERTGFTETARRFAVAQATGDWVVVLDADEMIPATLGRHLRAFLDGDPAADVLLIPRADIVLGRWAHANPPNWPIRKPRCFRPGCVEITNRIHHGLVPAPDARLHKLAATPELAIWHFSYPSVTDIVQKMDRYTTIQAQQALDAGKAPPVHARRFLGEPIRFLWRGYVRGRGYRDGTQGLIVAISSAFYRFLLAAKMWDLPRIEGRMRRRDEIRDRLLAEYAAETSADSMRPPGDWRDGS